MNTPTTTIPRSTYLRFTLSMPNRGSWNGKWSGEGRAYDVIKKFHAQKGRAKALEILQRQSYHYSWSDGWGASVRVCEVDGREATQIRRKTSGFCGYDWMVESICSYGRIKADHED